MKTTRVIATLLLGLSLAGCATVGPNFRKPEVVTPVQWHGSPPAGVSPEAADPKVLARWWKTLDDPLLDRLVERGLDNALTLKTARAQVREARAKRQGSVAGLSPTLDASASATRNATHAKGIGWNSTGLFSGGFDARWEIDLFGGTRRAIEAADADLAAGGENLNDVRVTLLAEIASTYVQLRVDQARLTSAEDTLKMQEETLGLVQSRVEAGLTDELALEQARTNLESSRSQIPSLRSGIETAMNALAVLTGENPGTLHKTLRESGPVPAVPLTVALGVPADLLRRRPDIRKAEADLAAQTARVGVATADLYPKFALSGAISFSGVSLLSPALASAGAGPGVSWALFDGGAVRSNIAAQDARLEQALIAWRATVLDALKEVQDAMSDYSEEKARRDALGRSVSAAEKAAQLAQDKYAAGMTDFTTVLDSERSLLALRDQRVQSEGTITTDLVRLYKALGGGWE
ncbi:MAG TPA: efflux transporter outer membrane subunit [Candidatus Deferrimicrobiaceae bacterium]|jgi:NodT family efflux transporter outer membrane factor (OMF) lipoprotein